MFSIIHEFLYSPKLLILSSCLFYFPARLAYLSSFHSLYYTQVVCASASCLYWVHPVPGIRLFIDKVCIRAAAIYFTVYGSWILLQTEKFDFYCLLFPTFVIVACLFYWYSCFLYNQNRRQWVWAHLGFHACMRGAQLVMILAWSRNRMCAGSK
jgi:hypothetical protein